MKKPFEGKSSIEEIEYRFNNDVERFSNLETGQTATIDAPLVMELITQAAVRSSRNIHRILDIGCGAGNNTLKLLQLVSTPVSCDLVDLSLPMLQRAKERIIRTNHSVNIYHGDFRTVELPANTYDVIIGAAVFHHLRDDNDWETAFKKLFSLAAPGGSIWISDLVSHEASPIRELMDQRYAEYLYGLGGEEYKDKVFEYIEKEDSPRSVTYQMQLLSKVGFDKIDLLHKNSCFAAFGAVKSE